MSEWVDHKTEAPMRHYRQQYRSADPEEIALRCATPFDAQSGRFCLTLLGRELHVGFPEFSIFDATGAPAKEGDARTAPAAQILLMRYLLEAHAAQGTGRFLSYRETPWGSVYDANFQGRCIRRLAYAFGTRPDAFHAAMHALGGTPIELGDAGYEIPFLNEHRLRAAVWSGDEEFPPSAQILFSDDFTLAFSAEDMAAVGDVFINVLQQTAPR